MSMRDDIVTAGQVLLDADITTLESEALERLCKVAEALLSACEAYIAWMDSSPIDVESEEEWDAADASIDAIQDQMRAAIAKAKGGGA